MQVSHVLECWCWNKMYSASTYDIKQVGQDGSGWPT